jgi:SAM-dependent methyltransferase
MNFIRYFYKLFSSFLFDPYVLVIKFKAIPSYLFNIVKYQREVRKASLKSFSFSFRDIYFTTTDKYLSSGTAIGHYFHQDIWAASKIYKSQVDSHIDIGSRIDGFVAHLLPFCAVEYVDIRPLESNIPNFIYREGSILNLPYGKNSVKSLSCLHVIEHIGLGRYGDPIDIEGHLKSAKELMRVLKPGGRLYIGTPVGSEKLCFDAHRVFNPNTILSMFNELKLLEFSLIDDKGKEVISNADIAIAEKCKYGCGLFVFTKV